MLALGLTGSSVPVSFSDAFDRARALANEPAASSVPCHFLLAAEQSEQGGRWVVVMCPGGPLSVSEKAARHERCLTAVQRFMLSLDVDCIAAKWSSREAPEVEALIERMREVEAEEIIGAVWCMPR